MAFVISETCYRYESKRCAENDIIADCLVKLPHNQHNYSCNYPQRMSFAQAALGNMAHQVSA
jgi:hypothetical protein